MRSMKTLSIALVSVLLLTILAACGAKQSSPSGNAGASASLAPSASAGASQAPAAQSAAPKELVKWKHGVIKPQVDAAFVLMAKEKEFFKKYGIDIDYQEFISAPLMSQALTAGAIDSAESNPMGAILANSKGGDLRIIGATMPGLDLAIFAKKEIKTIKDLQGKKIGTSAPNDLPDMVMRAIFQKSGLDTENATYAAVGGKGDRLKTLKAGAIDADVNSLDLITEIEADPNLHMIASSMDIVPEFPRLTVMVNGSNLKAKPEAVVVGVLAGMMEGLQYAIDHPDEAKQLAAKTMGLKADDPKITKYYDLAIKSKFVDPKMEFDPKRITWVQDFLISLKKLDQKLPMEKLIDYSYRDKALQLVNKK